MANFTTDLYLDTRYERKKDKRFPVKLRVTIDKETRWYGLRHYMTEKEFEAVMNMKARGERAEARDKLMKEVKRADELLRAMPTPNFQTFKDLYLQKASSGSAGNVEHYFNMYVDKCTKEGRPGTASSYKCAMRSFQRTMGKKTTDDNGKESYSLNGMNFRGITPDWLNTYQRQMESEGRSTSSVGVYLRALRSLFNRAIDDGVIGKQYYPFGRNKYQIPATAGYKRPLTRNAIKQIEQYSENPIIERYRDYFLLSYYTGGANFADIFTWRWDYIKGDALVYKRQKTKRTTTNSRDPVRIKVKGKIKELIEMYGNPNSEYIFDLVKPEDSPEERRRKIQLFTKACNTNLKRLAKQLGLPAELSSIWARHSATTHGIEAGISLAVISNMLDHANLATTTRYASSLSEAADTYLDFLQSDD